VKRQAEPCEAVLSFRRRSRVKPGRKVAIIGLGLMGGSLGLALKRRDSRIVVSASARREETRKLALELGAADKVFERPGDAVRDADTIVFCTPVLSIPPLAKACLPFVGKDAVLTDVGSTKVELVAKFQDLSPAFVGSHPIAGSEEKGLASAKASLYDGAVVVLTPIESSRPELIGRVENLWRGIGASTITMSPEAHDKLIARTSHLPHLLAASLATYVAAGKTDKTSKLCGPGFRDTTRVAAGPSDVWHDIVASNADCILNELDGYSAVLDRLRAAISARRFDEVRRFLEDARKGRGEIVD